MPSTGYSVAIDHRRLSLCRASVRAGMVASGFSAGRFKFDDIVERRARKLYQKG